MTFEEFMDDLDSLPAYNFAPDTKPCKCHKCGDTCEAPWDEDWVDIDGVTYCDSCVDSFWRTAKSDIQCDECFSIILGENDEYEGELYYEPETEYIVCESCMDSFRRGCL